MQVKISPWSIDALQDAWQLATRLHDGQKYGGPNEGEQIEYINHIGSVVFEIFAALAQTPGMDAHLALHCAVLHDVLEDTPHTYTQLHAQYGQAIADGVQALTKDESIVGKSEKMRDSLAHIRQQPHEVWAVKLADRICNLYAPPFYWGDDRKRAYIAEAQLILQELQAGNAYLAQRLATKIEEYQRFIG